MTKRKKHTKPKTPRRKSTRKRQRTVKGAYYDEVVLQGTSPAEVSINCDGDSTLKVTPTADGYMNAVSISDEPKTHTMLDVSTASDKSLGNEVTDVPSAPVFNDIPILVNTVTPECDQTPNSEKMEQANHCGITTPVGVGCENSLSLKRELEMAMLLQTNHDRSCFPASVVDVDLNLVKEIHFDKSRHTTMLQTNEHSHFPASVVDVDLNMVKEIHFDKSRQSDVSKQRDVLEMLQILNNFDDLYHAGMIENLFRQGEPVIDGPPIGGVCAYERVVEKTEVEVIKATNPNDADRNYAGVEMEPPKVDENDVALLTAREDSCKIQMLTVECGRLQKQLFEKQQELKVANNRISQLEDFNSYRKEVVRLEGILDQTERETEHLNAELEKLREELRITQSGLSDFITENTVLKNQMKQQKQTITDSGTQTTAKIKQCDKCVENVSLIDELIKLLDEMELSIQLKDKKLAEADYTLRDINELVHLLNAIEDSIRVKQNRCVETPNEAPGDKSHLHVMSSVSSTIHPLGQGYIPNKKDDSLYTMNKFHPVQFINTPDNQLSKPETQDTIPLIPGADLYSDVVKGAIKKVSVFSTSITKGVNVRELNQLFCGDKINIHRFHGKKAQHFRHYIPVHMAEDKPDTCVIVAGGNDLPGHMPVHDIANHLIDAAITCRNYGASKVIIASVLPREKYHCQVRRKELNNLLVDMCHLGNFTYMDNWNISPAYHLDHDGVHLNRRGSDQLKFNLLWYLNY